MGGPLRKYVRPKFMILVTSGVICGNLGTFWSDFRMQNHSALLKVFFQILNHLNASVASKRLQNVLSPKYFAFCTSLDHAPETVTTTGAPLVLTSNQDISSDKKNQNHYGGEKEGEGRKEACHVAPMLFKRILAKESKIDH